jgi:hypothetical protein
MWLLDLIERYVSAIERIASAHEESLCFRQEDADVARRNAAACEQMAKNQAASLAAQAQAQRNAQTFELGPVTEAIEGLRDSIAMLRSKLGPSSPTSSEAKEET